MLSCRCFFDVKCETSFYMCYRTPCYFVSKKNMPAHHTNPIQKSYFSYDFLNSTCEGDKIPFGETQWWVNAAMSVVCVLIASIAAGLTMGLVSIDEFQLMVLMESRPEESENAAMLR